MIIKGKNKSEISRQLGISKQAFNQRIIYCPESFFIDDDGNKCYDTEIKRERKKAGRTPIHINYDPNYSGNFITRKEYAEKYNINVNYIALKIAKKKLFTTEDGKLVSDIFYK